MKWFRWVLYGLFLFVCLGFGLAVRVVGDAANSLTGGGSILDAWQGVHSPRGQFPGRDRLNFLLVGMDYNRDDYGQIHPHGQRSDTIMILSMDLNSGKIQAVSVPRDTYVDAPDGKSGKINGTFARGGIQLLMQTLNSLLGVTIDHFVVVKPSAVREIVDAVGGVEVETIDEMHYKDSRGELDIDLPKGRQFLDGRKAEGFVRFREVNRYKLVGRSVVRIRGVKGSKEEGDIRRTARQQQLVQALIAQGMQPSNIVRAPQIIERGFAQIVTDLSRTQVLALATIVREAGMTGLASATLPGSDDMRTGVYYYRLDTDRAQALVDWLINGDDSAMRRLVRIRVKNGSGTKGVARLAAEQLNAMGYSATVAGNAPRSATTQLVFRKAAFQTAAKEIQQQFRTPDPVKDPQPANDWDPEIELTIGDDVAPMFTSPAP